MPLAALAILSTLFLLSRGREPGTTLPFADVDIEALLREPRLTAPTHVGVTADGASLRLTADAARPDTAAPGSGTVVRPRLLVDTPDGRRSELTAGEARISAGEELLLLSGGVHLDNSLGYGLDTEALTAALDRTRLESLGPVAGVAPGGTISAGRMELRRTDAAGPYVLVFTGGVKLLYQPPT